MKDYVQFYVHCSRNKQRYIVSGYVENDILVWVTGFIPRPGTTPHNPSPAIRNYAKFDASKFRCPCCETSGSNSTGFASWHCQTCGAEHCMGTDNAGQCHGACGNCVHPLSAFTSRPNATVQLAQGHDL